MRRSVLRRSVVRLLEPDEALGEAALMWTRHPSGYVYAAATGVAFMLLAIAAGVEPWPARLVIGLAGAAIAVTGTTSYRVLASTSRGLVLLEAARLRQVARRISHRLPPGAEVRLVRDTLITTDWVVDGIEYTVPKGSQRAMEAIAARRSAPDGV